MAAETARTARSGGIDFRRADSSNYARIRRYNSSFQFRQRVAGVGSTLFSVTPADISSGTLKVVVTGVDARAYHNNQLLGSVTLDAALASANVGLYTDSTNNEFDNFVVYPRGTSGEHAALDGYLSAPKQYFIEDDFTDTAAAGAVDGRSATPGAQSEKLKVYDDDDNTVSVAGGAMAWTAWSTINPWALYVDSSDNPLPIPRVEGRTIHFRMRQLTAGGKHMFFTLSPSSDRPFPNSTDIKFKTQGAGASIRFFTGGNGPDNADLAHTFPAAGEWGEYKIVMKASGATLYYKNVGAWELVVDRDDGSLSPLYLSWQNHSASAVASDGELELMRIYDE